MLGGRRLQNFTLQMLRHHEIRPWDLPHGMDLAVSSPQQYYCQKAKWWVFSGEVRTMPGGNPVQNIELKWLSQLQISDWKDKVKYWGFHLHDIDHLNNAIHQWDVATFGNSGSNRQKNKCVRNDLHDDIFSGDSVDCGSFHLRVGENILQRAFD